VSEWTQENNHTAIVKQFHTERPTHEEITILPGGSIGDRDSEYLPRSIEQGELRPLVTGVVGSKDPAGRPEQGPAD